MYTRNTLLSLVVLTLFVPVAHAIPLPVLNPEAADPDNPFTFRGTPLLKIVDEGPWLRLDIHCVEAKSAPGGNLARIPSDFSHYEAYMTIGWGPGIDRATPSYYHLDGNEFDHWTHVYSMDLLLRQSGDFFVTFPHSSLVGSTGPGTWVHVEVELHRTDGTYETILVASNPVSGFANLT